MKSNSVKFGWLVFLLLILVIMVLMFAGAITNNNKVKNYRDDIKNKADDLRNAVLKQQGLVNSIRAELFSLLSVQEYLLKKSKRICIALKCMSVLIVSGIIVMVRAIFSLNPVEFLLTFCSIATILYGTVTGVVVNEVRGFNDALRLLHEMVVQRTYSWYNFQPTLIGLMEQSLTNEEKKLILLKAEYYQFTNLN